MLLGAVKESLDYENRSPLTAECVTKYVSLGIDVTIESQLGHGSNILDEELVIAGAKVLAREDILRTADVIIGVRKPDQDKLDLMKSNCLHISFLDPFNEPDLIKNLAERQIRSISLEFIPRITRAQKMDALSSQANLGGYCAVITAAANLPMALPMMMTAAGTITPSKVFIIGVGVAGLQAIATAKRLGGRVEAFDTRPAVEEQVNSLGAKFIKIDIGETGQTKDGYAKPLTDEQIEMQREGQKKVLSHSNIVITTAQVFGRKAPVLITKDMIAVMKPGSVIVDMAVETGGNVEGSTLNQEIEINGVRIIGEGNLPGKVGIHASQVLANNIYNLVAEFWDKDQAELILNNEDEIIKGCLITDQGNIVNEKLSFIK